MKLMTINIAKLVTVLFMVSILYPVLSECQSADELERPKRTIGFLFRSFVNAFQTQRQPEPMVHSYQPLKQTKQPTTSHSTTHSTKAELLASSKNIFEQKKNLFKPPAPSQAPEVDLIKQMLLTKLTPSPDTKIRPQSEAYHHSSLHDHLLSQTHPTHNSQFNSYNTPNVPLQTPPAGPYKTPYQSIPSNSLAAKSPSSIPFSSHHPLKAHILILPFQEDHAATAPFPGFNPETSPPVAPSPINYQAEIYLQPSAVPSTGNHDYAARFSASNGWRDVEDIISRGNQKPPVESEERESKKNTNGEKSEISYNVAALPEQAERLASSEIQNGNQENYVREYNRGTQSYYEHQNQNSVPPLFVPQTQQSTVICPDSYQNANVGVDRSFQMDPALGQYESEPVVSQTHPYNTQNPADRQTLQIEHYNPNDNHRFLNAQNSEPKSSSSSDNYVLQQRGQEEEVGRNFINTNYEQTFHGNVGSEFQNLNFYPYIQDDSFGIIQYPTKIGRLPDFSTKY